MRVFGITGWKNTGKTTLMERLVAYFTDQGVAVSTIKHAHDGFDLDQTDTDSDRHKKAGAQEVVIASDTHWALMSRQSLVLPDLLRRLAPADLVLIEGYKSAPHPKIETYCSTASSPLIAIGNPSIRAIASDCVLNDTTLPQFDRDDVDAIAAFIRAQTGLT